MPPRELDPPYTTVLVYDGDCPFCSAAATAMRQLPSVGAVAWNEPAAQTFLEAQFGDVPFALFLADVEAETVWAGREAASELCDRGGMPVLVQDIVESGYERAVDAIRTVSEHDREVDPYHGAHLLSSAARDAFAELAARGRSTHRPRSRDRSR